MHSGRQHRTSGVCSGADVCGMVLLVLRYKALAAKAAGMRRGTIFISFTKALPPPANNAPPQFEEVEQVYIKQTWGYATAFIQRRL